VRSDRLSADDLIHLIGLQLGRTPQIDFRVQVECRYGWPAVIMNEAFKSPTEPNPNLYYLTCPFLRHELAVLEDQGKTAMLEAEIAADPLSAEALQESQVRHALSWRKHAGRDWDKDSGMIGPRIAAAAEDGALKCLHAYMAWHLAAGGDPVGGRLLEMVGSKWCDDDRCARLSESGSVNKSGDGAG
jgi:hypothetical protein